MIWCSPRLGEHRTTRTGDSSDPLAHAPYHTWIDRPNPPAGRLNTRRAHSFVSSWTTPDEAHYSAMQGLSGKLSPDVFADWVDEILSETDGVKRQANWTELLSMVHEEVLHLPIYGKRIPLVIARRLSSYSPGEQQFDYPIQNIKVESGSKNITVAPGAQSGLFTTVGRLDPHSYRPNEFFANNWVYEGLVTYGANGVISPALASSWTTVVDSDSIETVTFTLREGVTFHDGAEWNCDVAKLNFDHVFAEPLKGPWWHGWYNLPTALDSWSCDDSGNFVVVANKPYYPLLQELTYIRPLRMLSPDAFVDGITTSPVANNSCPTGWGGATCKDGGWTGASAGCVNITCAGTTAISGTGPFKFVSRTVSDDDDGYDDRVVFASFDDYWNGDSDVDYVHIVRYADSSAVETALLAGELDAVVGAGVLDPSTVQGLLYNDDFEVQHTDAILNSVVIMNAGTVDINVRKTVVHAVDKGYIIDNELGGIEEPVSQLFPESAPYCDIYLTPQFDYDFEKAEDLDCGAGAACDATTLDFILLEGDATAAALEDDISSDLAKVGITVNARYVVARLSAEYPPPRDQFTLPRRTTTSAVTDIVLTLRRRRAPSRCATGTSRRTI